MGAHPMRLSFLSLRGSGFCMSLLLLSALSFTFCSPDGLLVLFQLWVGERMPLATSTDHGHNLQTVQLLIKKNQVMYLRVGG